MMDLPTRQRTNPKNRYEIILAGAGGQGLILSAMLLGEGAIREGKNVVQTQSYGIAARGGTSVAELIIDTDEIIFQQVQEPDIILALTDKAMEQFVAFADRGALIFYDTTCIPEHRGSNFCGFTFMGLASSLGHVGTANLIALGAIVARTGMIHMDSLVHAVTKAFPQAAAVNIEAVGLGEKLIMGKDREGLNGDSRWSP